MIFRLVQAFDAWTCKVLLSFAIEHGLNVPEDFDERTAAALAEDDLYCADHGQRECANCLDSPTSK